MGQKFVALTMVAQEALAPPKLAITLLPGYLVPRFATQIASPALAPVQLATTALMPYCNKASKIAIQIAPPKLALAKLVTMAPIQTPLAPKLQFLLILVWQPAQKKPALKLTAKETLSNKPKLAQKLIKVVAALPRLALLDLLAQLSDKLALLVH